MRPLALAALLLAAAPAAAQTAQLSAEALTRIKSTTCYLKVRYGRDGATGTGFLVRKDDQYGWVATNNHVVTPDAPRRGAAVPPLKGVEVVFQSGTSQEWRAAGEVVARDPLRDLATVRFPLPKGAKLGDPLTLPGAKAAETLPVYICGFPFGAMLSEADKNPEISIGVGSVSSIRTDDRGDVYRVQINGAINPGNSGGPIVTADGRLVGVAVTTISKDGVSNAGIGHAVPPQHVKEMLDGRVSEPLLIRGPNGVLSLALVVDPFNRLKVGKGWLAPVADPAKKTVPGVSGLPQAKPFEYGAPTPGPLNSVAVVSTLQLAPTVTEVWAQSTWTDRDGATKSGRAYRTPIINLSARGRAARPGSPPGSGDGSDELPPGFFDGVPGLPQSPTPPGGGPMAGLPPGGPSGGDGAPPRAVPAAPSRPGSPPRPGRPAPKGPTAPAAPAPATEADSLQQLDRLATDPARTVGQHFNLWLTAAGVSGTRLIALRPDGLPLVGLRLELQGALVSRVQTFLNNVGRPAKAQVTFTISRLDLPSGEAVGLVKEVLFKDFLNGTETAPAMGGAAEDTAPKPAAAPAPQPAVSTPVMDLPPRPAAPPADDGMDTRLVVLIGGLVAAVVVGVAGIGAAVMYFGQPAKKAGKKKRPARDWDDEDDDYDDRPRRRRR